MQRRLGTPRLPKLTRVKQLELRVEGEGDMNLLPLTCLSCLMEACPYLQSIVLELMDMTDMLCGQRELKIVVGSPLQYLKLVEFYNYYGRPCDLELVNYLIENAIALEKLVVNLRDEEYVSDLDEQKQVKEPRERALQQLKGKSPSRIKLVIN